MIIRDNSEQPVILRKQNNGRLFHKNPESLPQKCEKLFPLFIDFDLKQLYLNRNI
jgi:hypothetical protein